MLIRVIKPPADEPVDVDELKEYLHIDCDSEDSLLSQLISAARKTAEEYQHKAYMSLSGMSLIHITRQTM